MTDIPSYPYTAYTDVRFWRELQWGRGEYEHWHLDMEQKKGMKPYRYNGPCPKCGFKVQTDPYGMVIRGISTDYIPSTKLVVESNPPATPASFCMVPERLQRQCGRCGYGWAEACVDEGTAPDTRPAALRGMEQALRDIQEQKAKMPADALSTEVAVLRRQLADCQADLRAFSRDVGTLGEALGHADIARPESDAILMARWIGEVRHLKALADQAGCTNRKRADL